MESKYSTVMNFPEKKKFIVHSKRWATFARVGGQMREGMSERYERINVQSITHSILLQMWCTPCISNWFRKVHSDPPTLIYLTNKNLLCTIIYIYYTYLLLSEKIYWLTHWERYKSKLTRCTLLQPIPVTIPVSLSSVLCVLSILSV